jgi:phytoene dehydrogenase-like protein
MATETRTDVVIVGGGIGGLACAVALARDGLKVVLLEASARLGGRGASDEERGFTFNQGPPAIFEPSRAMLASLGVRPNAPIVGPDASFVDDGEHLHVLPGGVGSFFGTSYLDARDRLSVGALLPALGAGAPTTETSFATWLDERAPTPRVRALVQMLARVATYGADPEHAWAPAVIAQIRAAAIAGVRYADGRWGRIVEALAARASEYGVERALRARALAIEPRSRGFLVRTDERAVLARDVVIAGPPSVAHGLLASLGDDVARAIAPRGPALRLACLDLGLARLPAGAAKAALGTREPTYVSVHSATAALAPRGGALVHAALYLGERAPRPKDDRAAIEVALDRAMPGWRSEVVIERFAPAALATSARVDARTGGLAGRPAVRVAPLSDASRGVCLVGDWVGARGTLLDGVLSSALEAARLVARARAQRSVATSVATSA